MLFYHEDSNLFAFDLADSYSFSIIHFHSDSEILFANWLTWEMRVGSIAILLRTSPLDSTEPPKR
jgi:hypothetical protein